MKYEFAAAATSVEDDWSSVTFREDFGQKSRIAARQVCMCGLIDGVDVVVVYARTVGHLCHHLMSLLVNEP